MAAGRSAAMIIAVTAAVCPLVPAGAGPAAAGPRMPAGARAAAGGGAWHTAQKVPGVGALIWGGEAQVQSVSCPPAGNCGAGGFYKDGSFSYQAFVASEVKGTWHAAIEMPGTAALNQRGGGAGIWSVSCVPGATAAPAGPTPTVPGAGRRSSSHRASRRPGSNGSTRAAGARQTPRAQ